jgi:hypothetical protein
MQAHNTCFWIRFMADSSGTDGIICRRWKKAKAAENAYQIDWLLSRDKANVTSFTRTLGSQLFKILSMIAAALLVPQECKVPMTCPEMIASPVGRSCPNKLKKTFRFMSIRFSPVRQHVRKHQFEENRHALYQRFHARIIPAPADGGRGGWNEKTH